MLKLGKKVEYGLMALMHMDTTDGVSLSTAGQISARHKIPVQLLRKILQALTRAGLIESVHGVKGGYRLARPLSGIRLDQVIEALEGPVHVAACQESPVRCAQALTCTIRRPIRRVQREMMRYLGGIYLSKFRDGEVRWDMRYPARLKQGVS